MALDPKEIMRRFPIGRILELQETTKSRITFLASVLSSIEVVQQTLSATFKGNDGPVTSDQVNECIENLLTTKPLEGMLSIALGNGWNGPDAYIHAQNNATCIRKIIWAMIYADIVQDYDICRQDWLKLKLSLLENPPCGGVLVKGYEFEEKDLGHKGSSQGRIDVCPDYPPASFLDDNGND
jgi:hypothetical protein